MIRSAFQKFFVIIFPALLASMLSFGQSEKAEAGIRDTEGLTAAALDALGIRPHSEGEKKTR